MHRSVTVAVDTAVLETGGTFNLAAVPYPYILYISGIHYGNIGTDISGIGRNGLHIACSHLPHSGN